MNIASKKILLNYSVSSEIRLSNRGNHWPKFVERRGRCEICSKRNIQSRPQSMCSLCNVFLCINNNKKCFCDYHEITF